MMDETTRKYLDEKFEDMATKSNLGSMETRLASTIGDVVTLIDKRFDKVDERFDEVNGRLEAIEDKVDPLVNQVSGHEKRMTFLEDKVLH